jgi:hypothetical protein
MATRLDLQEVLEELLGSEHVYYDPPATLKMVYPCIRYSRTGLNVDNADDTKYRKINQYELIVISKKADPEVVEGILELPYSSLGRPYKADNLNHYPITLYF